MKIPSTSLRIVLWSIAVILTTQACKEKEEDTPPVLSENAEINNWIKDVMDEVYYWLEGMKNPSSVDLDPEDYFEALLNRPTDRFSAIYPDYQELLNSLQGVSKEAGYELLLARESNTNNNVVGFVSYIKKGSSAEAQGLKRGDVITQINGIRITLDNYQDILGNLDEPHSVSFFRFNPATSEYVAQTPIDLSPAILAENPNFMDSIYTVNGEKIGYFVYHFFSPGVEGQPTLYDDQTDAILAKFKSQGIKHLVIDMRYNSGGYESSAINLASLIAPNVTGNDVFSKTKYNSFLSQFSQFQNVEKKFVSKSQNLGPTLSGNRIYLIVSNRTASASELVINGLKPYMDVFLVGDVTVGKNVGSVALEDDQNPDNKYGLLPIVMQTFNKNDLSDYANGFQPNIEGKELSQIALLPFGDTNEYLLNLTLNQIFPGSFPTARKAFIDRTDVGSTIDEHPRTGRLIMDPDFLKK